MTILSIYLLVYLAIYIYITRWRAFNVEKSQRQGCPLSPLLRISNLLGNLAQTSE